MTNIPAISVVLAVYNGAEFLEECVRSILEQTFTDFEFLIVDDASTDETPVILAQLAAEDERIIILTNSENKERSFSRNRAIEVSRGYYIACMDADDWAYPERLAKQYAFMEANQEVTICGSATKGYETGRISNVPCTDIIIRTHLLFRNPNKYPTMIFRKSIVMERTNGFNVSMPTAEDYDMWLRLAEHNDVVFANLAEPLVRYRYHPNNPRPEYHKKVKTADTKIRTRHHTLLDLDQKGITNWQLLRDSTQMDNIDELVRCGQWLQAYLQENKTKKTFDQTTLINYLQRYWTQLCFRRASFSLAICRIYYKYAPTPITSHMLRSVPVSILSLLKKA